MVIVNKVPHYRVTKLEPHTTDTQVRSGQLQFCHPNSEAPIIARKAIPKLTEMDKLSVLNTSEVVRELFEFRGGARIIRGRAVFE